MKPLMTSMIVKGVPNFYIVDKFIWRSGQPENEPAFIGLYKLGVKSIISLNSSTPDPAENAVALDWSGILPPTITQILAAIQEIERFIEKNKTPILIHCLHGSDRTGTLCACWRMYKDGYTFDEAMKEAFFDLKFNGMHEFWMASAVATFSQFLDDTKCQFSKGQLTKSIER